MKVNVHLQTVVASPSNSLLQVIELSILDVRLAIRRVKSPVAYRDAQMI